MVNFPYIPCFYDNADLSPQTLADEVVMYCGGGKQGRDGCVVRVDGAILEDEYFKSILYGIHGVTADPVKRGF